MCDIQRVRKRFHILGSRLSHTYLLGIEQNIPVVHSEQCISHSQSLGIAFHISDAHKPDGTVPDRSDHRIAIGIPDDILRID